MNRHDEINELEDNNENYFSEDSEISFFLEYKSIEDNDNGAV